MKDLLLILAAILVSATLTYTSVAYSNEARKIATIEAIEMITNNITDDRVNNALSELSDEQLTELMGL